MVNQNEEDWAKYEGKPLDLTNARSVIEKIAEQEGFTKVAVTPLGNSYSRKVRKKLSWESEVLNIEVLKTGVSPYQYQIKRRHCSYRPAFKE